jgi:hypothetical protein
MMFLVKHANALPNELPPHIKDQVSQAIMTQQTSLTYQQTGIYPQPTGAPQYPQSQYPQSKQAQYSQQPQTQYSRQSQSQPQYAQQTQQYGTHMHPQQTGASTLTPQQTGSAFTPQQTGTYTLSNSANSTLFPQQTGTYTSNNSYPQQSSFQPDTPQSYQSNPAIPWAVSPQEKASYDVIFKQYDPESTGFIDGALFLYRYPLFI